VLAGAGPADGLARHGDGAEGPGGWVWPSEVWAKGYLFARALTIGGGTAEVQRNIIAERVLGLPHDIDVETGQSWEQSRRVAV